MSRYLALLAFVVISNLAFARSNLQDATTSPPEVTTPPMTIAGEREEYTRFTSNLVGVDAITSFGLSLQSALMERHPNIDSDRMKFFVSTDNGSTYPATDVAISIAERL